jgi:hypothetical protein
MTEVRSNSIAESSLNRSHSMLATRGREAANEAKPGTAKMWGARIKFFAQLERNLEAASGSCGVRTRNGEKVW